jgi:hypothetical protein
MIRIVGKVIVKTMPASCSECSFIQEDWKCILTGYFYTSYVDRNPLCPLKSKDNKNRCYSPNCQRNAPVNDIFCKKHR